MYPRQTYLTQSTALKILQNLITHRQTCTVPFPLRTSHHSYYLEPTREAATMNSHESICEHQRQGTECEACKSKEEKTSVSHTNDWSDQSVRVFLADHNPDTTRGQGSSLADHHRDHYLQ
jgi:hypothetical protein